MINRFDPAIDRGWQMEFLLKIANICSGSNYKSTRGCHGYIMMDMYMHNICIRYIYIYV